LPKELQKNHQPN